MTLDPKSLRLFISVMKLGTISAAAEQEHIAAAAVSKRISDLEEFLATKLVVRSTKGLVPTDAGSMLLELAHRALHELEGIQAQMREYSKGMTGQVHLAANVWAVARYMPGELSVFLARNPRIKVSIDEQVSSAIALALVQSTADVGVLVKGAQIEGLEFHPYREDHLVLAVPENHALAGRSAVRFADTLDFDYVGLHANSQSNTQLLRAAREQARPWKSRVQVTSYDALCHMVEVGLGIGVLPAQVADAYRDLRIKLLVLDEPWARRMLGVCVRSYDGLTPAAKMLVDHLLR